MDKFIFPGKPWQADDSSLTSPAEYGDHGGLSFAIANDLTTDAVVSAVITPIKGDEKNGNPRVGALMLRANNAKSTYYSAGIGGYSTKFFIDKRVNGEQALLASCGSSQDINFGEDYQLSFEARGSTLTLRMGNVELLSARDSDISDEGAWGLRIWRTKAKFSNPRLISRQKSLCFVVMPFGKSFDSVFDTIEKVVDAFGFECIRADKRHESKIIMDEIANDISNAGLVIIDLSSRNPNVYLEAGWTMALKKKYILLAQSKEDLSFDVQHIRTLFYEPVIGGDKDLSEKLSKAIESTIGRRS